MSGTIRTWGEARKIRKIEYYGKTLLFSQFKDWSTCNADPGNQCPKCDADLYSDGYGDDTFFCSNPSCDFQYTLSARESANYEQRIKEVEDAKAIKEATSRARHLGPPVFGLANPIEYVLPSWRDRDLSEEESAS